MSIKKTITLFLLFIILLLPINKVFAGPPPGNIPTITLQYLQAQQQPDGGMPGLSGPSDPATTARALFVFKAHGVDPLVLSSTEGKTLIDFLNSSYSDYIVDDNGLLFPGNAGLMLAALATSDQIPEGLSDSILATLQPDGSFSTAASKDFTTGIYTDFSQALVLLGLAGAKTPIPAESVDYLINRQLQDGTWDNGFGSDPDTTAIVTIALLSTGQVPFDHPAILKALDYFHSTQLDNGGWRPSWDTDELNADTTGWISLALTTAAQDLNNWTKNSATPQDALLSQLQDDGSIGGTYVGVYSTLEALLGLATGPIFPILPSVVDEPDTSAIKNQAGLVIKLPDGSSLLRCVTFTGESTSGFNLLSTSGLKLDTFMDPVKGPGVCSIEDQGCPASNCFCDMPNYWSYWHLQDGVWAYSAFGAGTYEVKPGTVDGWGWGETELPASLTFDTICAPNAALYLPAITSSQETQMDTPSQEPLTQLTPIPNSLEVEKPIPSTFILLGVIFLVLVAGMFIIIRKKK